MTGSTPPPARPTWSVAAPTCSSSTASTSTGALIPPIGRLPFTEVTSLGQFSRIQLQEVQALAKIADPKARQAKIDNGAITAETIQRAVAETRPEFYQTLFEDAALAQEEFERFNEALKRKSGQDEATDAYNYDPPSGNIQQALQEYLDMVKELTKSKPAPKSRETKPAPQPQPDGAQANPEAPPPPRERGDRQPGGCPGAVPHRRRVFPPDRAAVDRALCAWSKSCIGASSLCPTCCPN